MRGSHHNYDPQKVYIIYISYNYFLWAYNIIYFFWILMSRSGESDALGDTSAVVQQAFRRFLARQVINNVAFIL